MSRSTNRHACNSANRAIDFSRQIAQGGPQQIQPLDPNRDGFDTARRLRDVLGVGANDQLLRTDEIAKEFRFPSPEAVRQYLRYHQVPFLTRGRVVLVDRRDLLKSMATARKRRLSVAR